MKYYKKKNMYNKNLDEKNYSEHPMSVRTKLVCEWLPKNVDNLLDVGCAWGYGTRFFKAKNVYGIEPHEGYVKIAKKRYPYIKFLKGRLEEKTPFKDNFFDAIVLIEVLEHVEDEIKTLNELFRILKPGGILIITTPHKGLFANFDSENYVFFIRKYFFWLYKILYKITRGKSPPGVNPGYEHEHKHYSLKDFVRMFNKSDFKDNYKILKVFRSGFLMPALCGNIGFVLGSLLQIFFGLEKASRMLKPLERLSVSDYSVSYGRLATDIAVMIEKGEEHI